jgi:hypothetical protein
MHSEFDPFSLLYFLAPIMVLYGFYRWTHPSKSWGTVKVNHRRRHVGAKTVTIYASKAARTRRVVLRFSVATVFGNEVVLDEKETRSLIRLLTQAVDEISGAAAMDAADEPDASRNTEHVPFGGTSEDVYGSVRGDCWLRPLLAEEIDVLRGGSSFGGQVRFVHRRKFAGIPVREWIEFDRGEVESLIALLAKTADDVFPPAVT